MGKTITAKYRDIGKGRVEVDLGRMCRLPYQGATKDIRTFEAAESEIQSYRNNGQLELPVKEVIRLAGTYLDGKESLENSVMDWLTEGQEKDEDEGDAPEGPRIIDIKGNPKKD